MQGRGHQPAYHFTNGLVPHEYSSSGNDWYRYLVYPPSPKFSRVAEFSNLPRIGIFQKWVFFRKGPKNFIALYAVLLTSVNIMTGVKNVAWREVLCVYTPPSQTHMSCQRLAWWFSVRDPPGPGSYLSRLNVGTVKPQQRVDVITSPAPVNPARGNPGSLLSD